MKRLSLVLTITTLTAYSSISQTSKVDTGKTCIPNSQLKQAVVLIEEGKISKKELAQTQEVVKALKTQVANKDSLVDLLQEKEYTLLSLRQVDEEVIQNLQRQIDNQDKIYGMQSSLTKKYKNHRWLFAILASAITFLIAR